MVHVLIGFSQINKLHRTGRQKSVHLMPNTTKLSKKPARKNTREYKKLPWIVMFSSAYTK